MVPQIEFYPLDDELENLCLDLLRAQNRNDFKRIVRKISLELKRRDMPVRVMYPPAKLGETISRPSWRLRPNNSLRQAQKIWRDAVIGPDIALFGGEIPGSAKWRKKPDRPPEQTFDGFQFSAAKHWEMPKLKLDMIYKGRRAVSGFRVIIREAKDLFDWLLMRAVANFQLSKFVHCVVCDRWELRKIAGRRSYAVAEAKEKAKSSRHAISSWAQEMPHWPAVCSNRSCKAYFRNVVAGRTAFRHGRFRGL